MKTQIKKRKDHAFKKDVYLLGSDKEGNLYWLESATFDCGWYWGFGYVETYTNNNSPSKSKDIKSHQHIQSLLGKQSSGEYIHNLYDFFDSPAFNENEGWTLSELFRTFYILKETAELYHIGGTNTAKNPLTAVLQNEEEEKRINEVLMPAVFQEIYKILSPSN